MLETAIGGVLGFSLFTLTSHPKSPLNRKIPSRTVWRFHITPEVKVRLRNSFLHFHHWLIFGAIYVFIQTTEKAVLHSDVVQGFVIGSIAQGLTYEDRFMVFYNSAQNKVRGKKDFYSNSSK
jgi:hypothetical protein